MQSEKSTGGIHCLEKDNNFHFGLVEFEMLAKYPSKGVWKTIEKSVLKFGRIFRVRNKELKRHFY